MAEVNWLNKLTVSKKTSEAAPEDTDTYPLAVDFDHVYFETKDEETTDSKTNLWTLKNFFDKISNFFKQKMFMKYSGEEVDTRSTIMEWYYVSGNGIDSRIDNNN